MVAGVAAHAEEDTEGVGARIAITVVGSRSGKKGKASTPQFTLKIGFLKKEKSPFRSLDFFTPTSN